VTVTCTDCDRDFDTEKGLNLHRRRVHEEPADDGWGAVLQDMEVEEPRVLAAFDSPDPFSAEPIEEQVPGEAPKTSWRDRLWNPSAKPGTGSGTAEKKPKKKRVATDGVWQTLWTVTGMALVRTGADIPVGNCLQFQAPIVGGIIDDAIAGTVLDKLVQPLAANGEKVKTISSVLAMPVLVAALERNPTAAPVLEPLLRMAIADHLIAMAPVIKEQRKKEAQYQKAIEELGVNAETGEDPIEAIIASIFPPMPEAATNGAAVHNAA
jgi:hypothetical protein